MATLKSANAWHRKTDSERRGWLWRLQKREQNPGRNNMCLELPSRELSSPTWQKGKSSNIPFGADMLVPRRVGKGVLCKLKWMEFRSWVMFCPISTFQDWCSHNYFSSIDDIKEPKLANYISYHLDDKIQKFSNMYIQLITWNRHMNAMHQTICMKIKSKFLNQPIYQQGLS